MRAMLSIAGIGGKGRGNRRMTRVVETTANTLLGIDIFGSLDNGARASIARHCHTYRYPARHDIVCNQDTSDDVYFVISGKVRATIFSRSGKVDDGCRPIPERVRQPRLLARLFLLKARNQRSSDMIRAKDLARRHQ